MRCAFFCLTWSEYLPGGKASGPFFCWLPIPFGIRLGFRACPFLRVLTFFFSFPIGMVAPRVLPCSIDIKLPCREESHRASEFSDKRMCFHCHGLGHLPSASEFLRQGHLGSGVTDQPLGPSAGLAGVCGCDLVLATINHGNDPLTTPLTEGMLQHHFSAFWLDQQESALL